MNPKAKTKLTKNKYRSSGKFLLCFRPTVVDINNGGSVISVRGCTDGSSEPVFTYVGMGDKQGVALPLVLPAGAASLPGDVDDKNMKEENGVEMKKKKMKVGHHNLLGIIKAVLFQTSMGKKIRKRRLHQKKCQPGEPLNESSLHKELSEVDNGNTLSNTCSSLKLSSIITSSSVCPSSLSSNCHSDTYKSFQPNIFERNQKQDNVRTQQHEKGCYSPNIGLCFIFISLLVLVFWGKFCAILCTSTWLFFVPRWTIGSSSSANLGTDSVRLDSDEYKKKIIMEGLLERNHFRGL